VPAGAGLKPKDSRLAVVRTLLSNSGQERCSLFGQHPQPHEELLVRKIVKRPDVEIDILGSNEATILIVSGLLLSDPLNDPRPVLRQHGTAKSFARKGRRESVKN
jgi:hypothetical protein